jgi:outer membrane biosynthesis protein TonB
MEFMQVMPAGDLAKGTPGEQAAMKVAPTTPAPSHPAASTPVPPPTPVAPTPPKPKIQHVQPPPKTPPIIKDDATEQAPPVKPPPPEPAKPKIKIDLSQLVDAPTTDAPKPAKVKPKAHPKKAVHKTAPKPDDDASADETSGLSREQVAAKLGAKLEAEGSDKGTTTGPDGSTHSNNRDFSEFKNLIHDKVMNDWQVPNSVDETAIDPIVHIHIEKDGYVPPESVSLERSSNNPAIEQSALEAARKLGHLSEPLPDGFPPDTSISFNLQQQ